MAPAATRVPTLRPRPGRARAVLLLTGMLLLAMNLRAPIVAVSAVLGRIIEENGLTAFVAGSVTALPVLAFALLTPGAAWLLARIGPDLAFGLTLMGVVAGTGVRSIGSAAMVLAGTVVIGAAITLGNLVVPMLIHRDHPPERRATVTGLYTVAINIGTLLTLVGTVPVADRLGWQLGLLVWTVLALAAGLVWVLAVGPRRAVRPVPAASPEHPQPGGPGAPTGGPGAPTARRARVDRATTWRVPLLTVTFGAQAFAYYAVTAWLPELLTDLVGLPPAQSGAGAALFQVFAVVGGLGVPLLSRRLPPWVPMSLLALCWVAVPAGLLLDPELWPLWLAAGGVAQGGVFTLVFVVVVWTADSAARSARSSATIQSIGYGIGATGPTLMGLVLDRSGGWTVPLLMVLAATMALATAGLLAVRGLRPVMAAADPGGTKEP
ncbi:CynX/NimT family MFS transporter [Promicromonospora sp. Populi]|uniref:MFS transporter n=1 Tax=Promicromonospora sp. Populi TaxID=3239420 RepID=UPI0034E22B45